MTEFKVSQLFKWANLTTEEDLDKLELKDMALNNGGQIDNPLVNRYCDLNHPANLNIALKHSKASHAGNKFNHEKRKPKKSGMVKTSSEDLLRKCISSLIPDETENEEALCPCCGRRPSDIYMPLNCNTTGMAPLGFAVPFFFRYIKFCMLQMGLLFILYSMYAMSTYVGDNYCNFFSKSVPKRETCGQAWNIYLSQGNGNPSAPADLLERSLFVASFIIMILLRIFYQYKFKSLDEKLDDLTLDITDYTVMVYNLPKTVTSCQLTYYFQQKIRIYDDKKEEKYIKIAAINWVFQDYEIYEKKADELRNLLIDYRRESEIHGKIDDLDKMQHDFNVERDKLTYEVDSIFGITVSTDEENKYFSRVAYVTFEKEDMANAIKDQLALPNTFKTIYRYIGYIPECLLFLLSKTKRENLLFKDLGDRDNCRVYVEAPHQPEDILWHNMSDKGVNFLIRKILSSLGVILLLGVSFVVLIGLKYWQLSSKASVIVSIALTIAIKIVNAVAMYFNRQFIGFEKIRSHTMLNTELVWRTTIMTFFNTVFQLVLVNILVWKSDLSSKLWAKDGLANDLWYFLVLAILDIIGEIVKPKYMIKIFLRWWFRRKMKSDGQLDMMQKDANELFEQFDFCFDERLAKYCKLLLISFFICSMFPMAPIISVLYMVIFYCADKLFLLRFAKVPSFCTGHIGHSMLRFFDFALAVYSGGYLLFMNIIDGRYGRTQIALFVFSIFMMMINVKFWVKLLFGEPEAQNEKALSFEEAKKLFYCNTYEQCNPIDKLKRTLHMYKEIDFFKIRKSILKKLSPALGIIFKKLDIKLSKNEQSSTIDNEMLFTQKSTITDDEIKTREAALSQWKEGLLNIFTSLVDTSRPETAERQSADILKSLASGLRKNAGVNAGMNIGTQGGMNNKINDGMNDGIHECMNNGMNDGTRKHAFINDIHDATQARIMSNSHSVADTQAQVDSRLNTIADVVCLHDRVKAIPKHCFKSVIKDSEWRKCTPDIAYPESPFRKQKSKE